MSSPSFLPGFLKGYRPLVWNPQYAMICTLPPSTPASANNNQNASSATAAEAEPTTFFFDVVQRVEHVQQAVGTKHPVQVGPAIVDHIYLLPARVVLDVVITDSVQSFQAGQYSGGSSKSVNAYQTFKAVQAARVPITLVTRLFTYVNMWLEDVRGAETYETSRSFRGTLVFEQIISAQVSTVSVSNRNATTGATNEGVKGAQPVPTELLNQIPLSHSLGIQ